MTKTIKTSFGKFKKVAHRTILGVSMGVVAFSHMNVKADDTAENVKITNVVKEQKIEVITNETMIGAIRNALDSNEQDIQKELNTITGGDKDCKKFVGELALAALSKEFQSTHILYDITADSSMHGGFVYKILWQPQKSKPVKVLAIMKYDYTSGFIGNPEVIKETREELSKYLAQQIAPEAESYLKFNEQWKKDNAKADKYIVAIALTPLISLLLVIGFNAAGFAGKKIKARREVN